MKTSAIILAAIVTLVAARPSKNTFQALGTQSCKASDSGADIAVYTIEIGEEYDTTGKAKCHQAIENLNKAVNGEFPRDCTDTVFGSGCCRSKSGGAGMTVYKDLPVVTGYGKAINEAFHSAFPHIGFNCPDY